MLTLLATTTAASAEAPSAGGAPVDQIMVVGAFTAVVYAAILWVLVRERTGHATLVGRAADTVARLDGSPRWFGLPLAVSVAGALSGAVGLYWDVSFHIAMGRDEGPLANPAHYFIFLGLIAIFAGGALALALAKDRLPRRTLRLTRTWQVPIGPAIGTAVALFALLGFPLDDVWHRLFGQDVTEWGPTHVLMIGGVLMLPYTMLLTCAEARQVGDSWLREALRVGRDPDPRRRPGRVPARVRVRRPAVPARQRPGDPRARHGGHVHARDVPRSALGGLDLGGPGSTAG